MEGIREQKRAAEGYEEIGAALNHGRHEGRGGGWGGSSLSDRP